MKISYQSRLIWGCGSFQCTYSNRVEKLNEFYSMETGNENITYEGAARAEANMLIYELTDSFSGYSAIDDNFESKGSVHTYITYNEKLDLKMDGNYGDNKYLSMKIIRSFLGLMSGSH